MSIESRASGRWVVVSFVVLAAAGLALLFRAGNSPPRALGGPVAVEAPQAPPAAQRPPGSGGAQAGFDWSEGPELERSYQLADAEPFELSLDAGDVVVRPVEGSEARVRVELVGGSRPPAHFEWESTRDEASTRLRIRCQDKRSWLSRLFSADEKDEVEILVEGEPVKVDNRRARVGRVLVELPANSPLVLRSGTGKLTVSDRRAAVSVDSGVTVPRLVTNSTWVPSRTHTSRNSNSSATSRILTHPSRTH